MQTEKVNHSPALQTRALILVSVAFLALVTACGTSGHPATGAVPTTTRETDTAGLDTVSRPATPGGSSLPEPPAATTAIPVSPKPTADPGTDDATSTTIGQSAFVARADSVCTKFAKALAALDMSAATSSEDAEAVIATHVSLLDRGGDPPELSLPFNDFISTFIEFRAEVVRYSAASLAGDTNAQVVDATRLSEHNSTMNADAQAIGANDCVNVGAAVIPAGDISSAATGPAQSSPTATTSPSGEQIVASDASLRFAHLSGYEWIPFEQDHPTPSPSTDSLLAAITEFYFVGEMRNVGDGSTIRIHLIFLRRGQHWTHDRRDSYSRFELGDLTSPAITPENSISLSTAENVVDGFHAAQFTLDALGVTILAPDSSDISVLVDQFLDGTKFTRQTGS
jgi:hypothetical protein